MCPPASWRINGCARVRFLAAAHRIRGRDSRKVWRKKPKAGVPTSGPTIFIAYRLFRQREEEMSLGAGRTIALVVLLSVLAVLSIASLDALKSGRWGGPNPFLSERSLVPGLITRG